MNLINVKAFRLHRNLCEAIISLLQKTFGENKYADKVIESVLRSNPKWGSKDRAFIAETTYEIVRWWRLLWYVIEKDVSLEPDKLWFVLGAKLMLNGNQLPDWNEFAGLRDIDIQSNHTKAQDVRKVRESIPDWLDELGEKELADKWETEINSLNKKASVCIRTNTLKLSREELIKKLREEGAETLPVKESEEGLVLQNKKNLFGTQVFKDGMFELQDISSQMVSHALDVKPGMRVIDACAGAGGKSLHIAALMKNKGRLISLDTEEWKLQELKRRAKRAGISIIETKLIESSKTIKRLAESADRVLLDVPCSGLGVLKRNPDTKWKLSPESLERVKTLQQDLLQRYSQMVKPGGLLVYSTCSILSSENGEQVKRFLESNHNFSLLKETSLLSSEMGYDGFYIAVIKKESL